MRANVEESGSAGEAAPAEFVQSLERGLAGIRACGPGRSRLTLSEVAVATGLTPATARRFLLTLQALGYVAGDKRHFTLKPRMLELGYAYLASLPWWRHAQTVAERIGGEAGQPCAVGVLDGDAVVFVAYTSATRLPLAGRSIGTRLPAYAAAVGRVLLAGLPRAQLDSYLASHPRPALTPLTVTDEPELRRMLQDVSELGYSFSSQDLEIGLASLGVAVRDRGGAVFAGLSVSFGSATLSRAEALQRYRPVLESGATEIAEHFAT